jgi:hypothetical protein
VSTGLGCEIVRSKRNARNGWIDTSSSLVIKPLEEDLTPGTVKPVLVSLVEPVAYPIQLTGLRPAASLRRAALNAATL